MIDVTYDLLDELVDLDTIRLRDVAWAEIARLRQELDEARAERDRLRALFDKLLALVPEDFGDEAPLPELPANGARPEPISTEQLVYLWVRYRLEAAARSAAPDAEPAPGVPVDTEATP